MYVLDYQYSLSALRSNSIVYVLNYYYSLIDRLYKKKVFVCGSRSRKGQTQSMVIATDSIPPSTDNPMTHSRVAVSTYLYLLQYTNSNYRMNDVPLLLLPSPVEDDNERIT